MSRIVPRRMVASTGVVAVLALAVACGGSEPRAAEPTGTASEESMTAAPSEEPSEEGVAPATGKKITLGPVSLRVPEGFRVKPRSDSLVTAQGPGGEYIGLGVQTALREQSLDELVEHPGALWMREPTRLADHELDEFAMFHLRGTSYTGGADTFGATHDGYFVYLEFIGRGAAKQHTEWVEPVLASLEWS